LYETVAGTSEPAPCARSLTLEVVSVAGFIASSKVALTLVPAGTPVAPDAGVRPMTAGGVVSGAPAW